MSWSVITSAEVLQEWNTKEAAAIKAQQAAVDNLPAILARVVNKVRDSVLAGGGRIGTAGQIPDQLREDVIAIARWNLLLSLPEVSEPLLSKSRRSTYEDAMKRIDLVAKGEIKVVAPDVALAATAPGHAVSVPRPGRKVDACGFGKMGAS